MLNQTYEPLAICTVKKAIILVVLEKAQIIVNNNQKFIYSVNTKYPIPSVIKLNNYITRPFKKVILSRKNVLRRDGYKCAYCGRSDLQLTIDHVIPKSKGGEDVWENMVAACLPCNNKKGVRTLGEANLILKINPYHPNHIMFILNNFGRINELWKPYLFNK
ncbi:MAG: HNH endonuclease [bacterium]